MPRWWKQTRPKQQKSFDRLSFIRAVVFVFAALIVIRLSDITIFQHSFYEALAADQHSLFEKLIPKRGEIYVQDKQNPDMLYPLAANETYYLVYAEPMRVTDPVATSKVLASTLELDEAEVLARLQKPNDLYEPIKHRVAKDAMQSLKDKNLTGIQFQEELYRYYPENNIGSHILGFVGNTDNKQIGQYGLEGYWETELAGEAGYLQAEKDAQGRLITFGTKLVQDAKDGDDLVLTVDHTIQYKACKALDEEVLKHGADGGSLIIMDPATGAVTAMCGNPDFDPNAYNEVEDVNTFVNPATYYVYEPGSIFKTITMAAAIDRGAVGPDTTYTDTGSVEIGKYTIKNSDLKAHGVQTMTQVLEQSLNTGAIFAARSIGPETFEDYVKRFGFGVKSGIELNSEAKGDITSLAKHQDLYMATASFGQGISATLLQMTAAYGAIANGGKLMKPYIVDEIRQPDGFVQKIQPQEVRQVVSSKTATTVGAMLVNVVRNGHGKQAGVAGYFVAGKTGTAQIPNPDGPGYDPNHTIGSFCGFAPVDNPVFVMCVKIDKPRDVQWAESTAAPLFGTMAQFMLNYYGIPPEETVK